MAKMCWKNNIGPDLILVENTEGIMGYVKASDFDQFAPTTPEEAAVTKRILLKYASTGWIYKNRNIQAG